MRSFRRRSLRLAKDAYEKGERNAAVLKALVTKEIAGEPLAAIDYVDLFSFPALEAIGKNGVIGQNVLVKIYIMLVLRAEYGAY